MKKSAEYFSKGFSTLEILISLAIFASAMSASLMLLWYERVLALEAEMSQRALLKAQSHLEQAKGDLAQDFFTSVTHTVSEQPFNITVSEELLSPIVKKVTAEASWALQLPGNNKLSLDARILDTSGVLGADTCTTEFSGNWQYPTLRGAVSLAQNNPATAVDASNGKAYLATNASSQSWDDFFVFDSNNLDAPIILKSINTGPGLNGLHVAGDYVFAANSSINGQLQILDIHNPANPVSMLNVKLPGSVDPGVGQSVFYYKDRVYIGTPKNAGPEFYVYDVSNPLAPVFKGSFEIGSVVNKIYVYGNYAYLATGDVNHFRILDISNPGHILEVGDFSGAGGTAQSGESVSVLGKKAILGRAGGLPNAHIPELYLLNIEHPENIENLNSADVNMSINGIFMRNGLAFLATNKTGGEFQVFSLANDQLSPVASAALPAPAVGIDCEGENIFLALGGSTILQIVSPQ